MANIYGTNGDDKGAKTLTGTALSDKIYGLIGHDALRGMEGQDELYGNAGNDLLLGGDGEDWLVGGAGADQLFGDFGGEDTPGYEGLDDTASYELSPAGVSVSLGTSTSFGHGYGGDAEGDVLHSSIEWLSGSNFADLLIGNGDVNELHGRGGADFLYGGMGDDRLYGGDGNDILYGQAGDDWLHGGKGADIMIGSTGIDGVSYRREDGAVFVDLQNNTGGWAAAGDKFSSIEKLIGSEYGDWLKGDGAGNRIWGYLGNDLLDGREGDDELCGDSGKDWFVYKLADTAGTGGGRDEIDDFQLGEDKISISVDWGGTGPGSLHVSGHQVFDILDTTNDNKLTKDDQWVDKAGGGLILDIGAGVGAEHFGGVGEDTLMVHLATWTSEPSLSKSDFAYA